MQTNSLEQSGENQGVKPDKRRNIATSKSKKVKRNLKNNRLATGSHVSAVKHRIGCEPGLPSQWGNGRVLVIQK